MADDGVTEQSPHTENWETLPWREFERNVFRIQKRIYQAARQGNA